MINPTGNEFDEEIPTSASADVGAFQKSNRGAAETASDAWEQTKEKAERAQLQSPPAPAQGGWDLFCECHIFLLAVGQTPNDNRRKKPATGG
jgi:hypothetical protein